MLLRYALDVISIAILGNLIFVFLPLSPLLVLRGKFFVRWHLYAFLKYIKAFSFLGKHKDVIYKRRFNGFTLTRTEEYTTTAKLCDSESYEIIGENPTKIYYYDKKYN